MLIRRERAQDVVRIQAVVASAFAGRGPAGRLPLEAALLNDLRSDPGWLPLLSLVAIDPRDDMSGDYGYDTEDGGSTSEIEGGDRRAGVMPRVRDDDMVVGYVTCTRAYIDDEPGLGLGPLAVRPDRQRQGVGQSLVHAVLGMADGLGEPFVGLLGSLDYYRRFGFRPSRELGIEPPDPSWGEAFQVRPLAAFKPVTGIFRYATPFRGL